MSGRVRVVCRLLLAATVLSVIACSGERSTGTARGGSGGTVRVAGSGGVPGVDGGGGASGAGGTGTAVDAGGADGGAGGSTGDALGCPMIVRNGAPCSEGEVQGSCPITECSECIGGAWKFQAGTTPICVCAQGLWMCIEVPGGGGPIGDCIHEAPFTCVEAQTLYTDATCTVHPPCMP